MIRAGNLRGKKESEIPGERKSCIKRVYVAGQQCFHSCNNMLCSHLQLLNYSLIREKMKVIITGQNILSLLSI